MAIISVVTTVSYRYYEKRSKEEVIRRIHEMERQLTHVLTPYETLRGWAKDKLIRHALALHQEFPE